MSNGRRKYSLAEIDEINRAFNFPIKKKKKATKNYDEKKRRAQRIKFCCCSECGGMMSFVSNTNTLLCENIITKEKIYKNKDGVEKKITTEEPCGNVKVISNDYLGFLNYLFDDVPANQAVIDFKNKEIHKSKNKSKNKEENSNEI